MGVTESDMTKQRERQPHEHCTYSSMVLRLLVSPDNAPDSCVISLLPMSTLRPVRLSGWFQVTQPVRGSTGLGHRSQESREPTTGRLGGRVWSAPPEQAACWVQEARVLRVGEGSPLGISPGEVGTVAADLGTASHFLPRQEGLLARWAA